MTRVAIACLLLPLAARLGAAPPLPVIPSATFNVITYGAVGDGATDNTTAIQAALTAARDAGGGVVTIPVASLPYLSGPLTVYSSTNLQVASGAVLKALPFGTYPKSTSSPSNFIIIPNAATNVAITGAGTIDGNGAGWWTAYEAGTIVSRPRLIYINRADTVLFSGLTLRDSPTFALAFSSSNNVTIDGVTVTAPEDSPNTDAIDPAGSHYLIQNCHLSVGDDNIAIKPGSVFCSDIVVRNCFFGTGHGLSIGGQTNQGLDGLTVTDCTFEGTVSGLRMKADPSQGGPVRNVSYSNIRMTNVRYPIVFYSYYAQVGNPGSTSGSNQTTPAKVAAYNATPPSSLSSATLPSWKNIRIDNLVSTGSWGHCILWGLPLSDKLISEVTLNNVSITGTVGFELFNAANVQFTGTCSINVPDGVPSFITYNAHAITSQPQSQSIAAGRTVSFSVGTAGASGIMATAPAYQWKFNGVALVDGVQADGTVAAGATSPTLSLSQVQATHAGDYTVTVSNSLDTHNAAVTALVANNTPVEATSQAAVLTVNDPAAADTQLYALSCRTKVGTGEEVLMAGFIVGGSGSTQAIVRSSGPALQGVGGALARPQLRVHQLGVSDPMASNFGWSSGSASATAALQAAMSQLGLDQYPVGSADCALLSQFETGKGYSAVVSGADNTTGVGMVEVYQMGSGASHLSALSCLAKVGTGEDVLFAGLGLRGSASKQILFRASGPTVLGGNLAQPRLELYRMEQGGPVKIAENTRWTTAGNTASIYQATLNCGLINFEQDSANCAILITLSPGGYAASVSGVNDSTGIAIIEIYEVP